MVSALEKFGVISICVLTIHFARKMSDFFYKRSISQYYKKRRLKELGQWGVVVGADKSMGQSYAVELAKQGLNIVLIGSNLPKLTTLSNLLEKYFQVFTGVISLTFTTNEFRYIEKALWNLDVAILVNAPDYAVGVAQPGCFLHGPELDLALSSLVNKNLLVVTKMCAIVLPGMVSKGKGIIVNVASVTLETSPLMALSEASAAYIEKLSEELRNQYSCTGVVIQCLLTGCVLDNKLTKRSFMVPWVKDYSFRMIKNIGFEGEAIARMIYFLIHTVVSKIQGLRPHVSDFTLKKLSESSNEGFLLNEY